MKRNHSNYSNIKRWKEEENEDIYAIVPAAKGDLWQLIVGMPFAVAFYWILHSKLEIADALVLLIAELTIIATTALLIVRYLYARHKATRDMRPHLLLSKSTGELLFPRHDKIYHLKETSGYFIAHDFFDAGGGAPIF